MALKIGPVELRGGLERYAERFDLLELRAERGRLPRLSRLAAWRRQVPSEFVFSVVLPTRVASLVGGADARADLDYACSVAEVLAARFLVVRTPASVTPDARHRLELGKLFDELSSKGSRVAWEPRGVWERAAAAEHAAASDVILVTDVTRDEPPSRGGIYTRIAALGESAQLRPFAAQSAGEALAVSDDVAVG
jgi:uncharacterized protein YecE (DUF72 family)